MMGRYLTYKMSVEPTRAEYLKLMKGVEHDIPPEIMNIMRRDKSCHYQNWVDLKKRLELTDLKPPKTAMNAESIWAESGFPTIFIDSMELLALLYECEMPTSIEEISVPISSYPIISVAIPDNIMLSGVHTKPFLFGRVPILAQEIEGYNDSLFVVTRNHYLNADCILIANQEAYDHFGTDAWKQEELEKGRTSILRMNTASCLFRIGVALDMYVKTFPEFIVDGAPKDREICKKQSRDEQHVPLKPMTVQLDPKVKAYISTNRSAHFRRAHYRILHDERFKRNPDGSKKIVFVKASQVRGHETVKTATLEEPTASD